MSASLGELAAQSVRSTFWHPQADHKNLFFGDVHARGTYPGYILRYFHERGIELDITDEDRELLQHTVDFVSFSYYMSICESADPAPKVKGGATSSVGYPIPP